MKHFFKSFYLMRHGQTQFNVDGILAGEESDIPLTQTGCLQAKKARAFIKTLEIDVICHSPMHRVLQTMDFATADHSCKRIVIDDLRECPYEVGKKMFLLKQIDLSCKDTATFFSRALNGLQTALSSGEKALVIAHGGIHKVFCHQLDIRGPEARLGNCEVAHYFMHPKTQKWHVEKVYTED